MKTGLNVLPGLSLLSILLAHLFKPFLHCSLLTGVFREFFVLFCHIVFVFSLLHFIFDPLLSASLCTSFYTLLPFAPFALHCFLLLPLLWPFFIFIYSIPLFSFPFLLSHTAIHFPFTRLLPLSTFISFASSYSKCWHHAQIKMLIKAALHCFLLFSSLLSYPLSPRSSHLFSSC